MNEGSERAEDRRRLATPAGPIAGYERRSRSRSRSGLSSRSRRLHQREEELDRERARLRQLQRELEKEREESLRRRRSECRRVITPPQPATARSRSRTRGNQSTGRRSRSKDRRSRSKDRRSRSRDRRSRSKDRRSRSKDRRSRSKDRRSRSKDRRSRSKDRRSRHQSSGRGVENPRSRDDSAGRRKSEDEEESLARILMSKLTPAVLSKLRRSFHKSKEKKRADDIERRVEQVMRQAAAEEGIEFAKTAAPADDPLWLDRAGFVAALERIFGHHKYTPHAHALFQLLDGWGTGRVRWRQLVCRLVGAGARRTQSRADLWTPVAEPRVVKLDHCKRETIVKMVSVEREDSFSYVCVSRGGRVGVYSGGLQLVHTYEVFFDRTGIKKRVKNCWITDAVYASDVQSLIISASDRSLMVYDVATLTHTAIFCITGLPNIPVCMAYTEHGVSSPELALCGERGDVTRLRFLQPRALFYAKHADRTNCYFWMELSSPPHTSYVAIQHHKHVHSRAARRAVYTRGAVLATCAHDAECSVRLKHLPGKMEDYVFKVPRGVTCFHVVPSLRLVAGGSRGGRVRLWQAQPAPFAVLPAPAAPAPAVIDVYVHAHMKLVLAYCADCCVYIWDLYEECLLQTVKIRFPFLGVLGNKVEFGPYCIFPGPARQKPVEEDPDEDLIPSSLEISSRRSSVVQGSTGGLILQDEAGDASIGSLEEDSEYGRNNRPELLISCGDHVCVLQLCAAPRPPRPAPAPRLRARPPAGWHLPPDAFTAARASPPPPRPQPHASLPSLPSTTLPLPPPGAHRSSIPSSMLLSPAAAEQPLHDLDTLLENAGLQGILEKDFVLMQGLKHDLNKKLADMRDNMDSMSAAVSACAPHRALRVQAAAGAAPADLMTARYRDVMRLFPESSLTGTPTASNTSTPRKRTSTQ